MTNLLLGGLITLVVTLAVQTLVVPRVQDRTRGKERWETDALDLRAITEETLPRECGELERQARMRRFTKDIIDAGSLDDQYDAALQAHFESNAAAEREAAERVDRALDAVARLEYRIQRRNPRAPFWRSLSFARTELVMSVIEASLERGAPPNSEYAIDASTFDQRWGVLRQAHEHLREVVREITGYPIRPPSEHRLRRARKRLHERWRSFVRRGQVDARAGVPPRRDLPVRW